MNMNETSASYATTGEQEGQVVYDLCYETARFDNDENERGDNANIQTAHSDALFTLQPAVEETLGLIRNLDSAKILCQSKMIVKIEQKSSLRKHCSLKQLDRDVLLLVRECKTSVVPAVEELGKIIRRRWAAKYEEIQCRIDMASASTRTYATMQEIPYSSEIPTRLTKKPASTAFYRRDIWPLQLICKPLRLQSAATRSCLSTLLDAMHGLDTSVTRYELLCHVLSFGWDYLKDASSDGSLFVQPISDPLFVSHTNNMKAEFYHIQTLCAFPATNGCIDAFLDNVVRIAESCRVIFAENIGFQKCVAEFTAAWQVFCVQAATKFPSLCSGQALNNVVGSSSSSSASLLSFADALHAQMHSLSAQLGVHVMLKKQYPTAHQTMSQTYERMKQLPASESHEYIARRLLDIGWEFLSLADADGLLVQSIRDRNPPKYEKSALSGLLQRKERIVLHRTHCDSLEDLDRDLYINASNYYELWKPDVAEGTQIDRQHSVRLVHLWSVYCKAVKAAWPEMISFVAPQLLYAPAPAPAPAPAMALVAAPVAAVVLAVSPVSQHAVNSPSQISQANVGINNDALFAFYSSAKYNNFSSTSAADAVDEASQGLSVKSSNSARYSSPAGSAVRGDGQQLDLTPTVKPAAVDACADKSSSATRVFSPDLNLGCNDHIGKKRDDCDDNTDASDDSHSLNSVDSDEVDGNESFAETNNDCIVGACSGGRRCIIKDNVYQTHTGLESSSGGKRSAANASSHNFTVSAAATSEPPAGLCAIGRKRKNDFPDGDNALPAPSAKKTTSTASRNMAATDMSNVGITTFQQRIDTLRFLALNAPNETDKSKAVQLLFDIIYNK